MTVVSSTIGAPSEIGAVVQRADLTCRSGSKDAVYHLQIVRRKDGYTVDYANGRRGGTLANGTKTKSPVALEAAQTIFDKVVREKMTASPPYVSMAVGVERGAQNGAAVAAALEVQNRRTRLVPQLLNSVGDEELERLFDDPMWVAQQKMDGERRLLISEPAATGSVVQGWSVIAANRRGLSIPVEASMEAAMHGVHCILDGEHVGERFYAFDVLDLDGQDLRDLPYEQRKARLDELAPRLDAAVISVVCDARSAQDKRQLLAAVSALGQEGIVFKRMDAPYTPDRPSSGGPQLKYKLVEDATVVVVETKPDRRSAVIGVYDDDSGVLLNVGAVTIPPNHEIPAAGTLAEVRYLYAYPEGSLFQPVFKGPRTDVGHEAAKRSRIKYKGAHLEVRLAQQDEDQAEARERRCDRL